MIFTDPDRTAGNDGEGAARRESGQTCLVDRTGRIVWVNETWRRTSQRLAPGDPKVGVGANYFAICATALDSGHDAQRFADLLCRLLVGDLEFFDFEYSCPTPDLAGRRFIGHVQAITVDGSRCALIAHDDVARERLAQEQQRASEERLRQTFEAAPDAVFVLIGEGPDVGRIVDANSVAVRTHGYSRDELLGMRIGQLDVETDAARVGERLAQLMRDGHIRFEATHVRRDGSQFPVEISASTTTIDGRRHVVSFNRDISERHRVEAELRDNQIRLHLAARASQVGFWDWDLASNRVIFSAEWKAQLGYEPHEIGDEYSEWERRVHPEDLPQAMAAVQEHLDGHSSAYTVEFRMRHKNGGYRWIYVRGAALRDPQGKPLRLVGCHIDITAQKEAERERALLDRRLNHLQRLEAMGTLAGGIAHDFNNILSIISGNVEFALLDKQTNVNTRDCLDEIRKAGLRARSLVRQILAFSRDEKPQRQPLSLGPIVIEASLLLRATIPQSIQLETGIAPELPMVLADAEQIHQCLVNLGTNAWHAIGNRAGHIRIHVSATGPDVMITFGDDGDGMDEATRARVFEPFFTTKPTGKGTGLGLSVVHGIVENHDGSIDVESTPGAGTTFHIRLPAYTADAPTVTIPQPDAARAPTIRTLLIDDEPPLLRVLQRGLARLGHDVHPFADPCQAIEWLAGGTPPIDALITDYDMPAMRGVDVVRAALAKQPDLPIVLCSGFLTPEALQEVTAAGVSRVLYKPVLAADLDAAVRGLLARSTSRTTSS